MTPQPSVTELVRAFASHSSFSGLTPTTRSTAPTPGRTSEVIEQLISALREPQRRH